MGTDPKGLRGGRRTRRRSSRRRKDRRERRHRASAASSAGFTFIASARSFWMRARTCLT